MKTTHGEVKSISIRGGAQYVQVHTRVGVFHKVYKNGKIVTEIFGNPVDHVFIKATVTPDCNTPERFFVGHSQAKWTGTVNGMSALENAETSAVGRALGMLGIGIEDAMCTADEVYKAKPAQIEEPDNVVKIPLKSNSVVDVADRFIAACSAHNLTEEDLYVFSRSLNEASCKKVGLKFPAVPPLSGVDKPFMDVAENQLLDVIGRHPTAVRKKLCELRQ